MFQSKEKYHIYITHNTYRGMLLEAGRHPGNESIIQMPGIRIGNDFFFDMVADSGINATYTPTMCEKDHVYAQKTNAASDTAEAESVSVVDDQETATDDGQVDSADKSKVQVTYLMPDSAEKYLEVSNIENYSHDEVQLIINEIYARHGREFHSQENIDYFNAQDWYEPVSGKSDEEIVREFNEFEKANVDLLSKYL